MVGMATISGFERHRGLTGGGGASRRYRPRALPARSAFADLIGRSSEVGWIERALRRAEKGRSGSVVVAGGAGTGKTALLQATVTEAKARGHRVVAVTGLAADQELAYLTVHDLCRPFLERMPSLGAGQRSALRGALALADGTVRDRFTTAAAVLGLLAGAADRPVTVVIDDLQWVDQASLDVIVFLVTRLADEGIVVALGLRSGASASAETAVASIDSLVLGPLAAADARRVVQSAAPGLGGDEVDAIVAVASGNPLTLVESARERTAGRAGGSAATVHPAQSIFGQRIGALPEASRRALLVTALTGSERIGTADVLGHFDLDRSLLGPVIASGLGTWSGDRFVLRHPLVVAAVLDRALPEDLQGTRLRLAGMGAVIGEDRAVWHRSEATTAPDAATADALDRVGRANLERGALVPAADALTAAARLSSDPDHGATRLADAAEAETLAGRYERAEALAEEAVGLATSAPSRVGALRARAVARRAVGTRPSGQRELIDAVGGLGRADRHLAGKVWTDIAVNAIAALDAVGSVDAARRAVELVGGDDGAAADLAHAVLGAALTLSAEPEEAAAHLDRWQPLLDRGDAAAREVRLLPAVALTLVWAERYDQARELLDSIVATGRRLVMPTVLPAALVYTSILEFGLGNWSAAVAAAGEAIELAEQTNARGVFASALAQRALLAALQGRSDECTALLDRVLRGDAGPVSRQTGEASLSTLAEIALGEWRFGDAVALLEPLLATRATRNPAPTLWEGPLVEGYLGVGRIADGVTLLDSFDRQVTDAHHRRGQAMVARCRGLVPGADYDRWFARSVDLVDAPRVPFPRARVELYWGELLTADGRDAEAHHRLLHAVREFDRLEARPWADRAAVGLRKLGDRSSADATSPALSDRERLVVRSLASGGSTDELAAALFLSRQTVGSLLSSALAKLGIDDVEESPDRLTGRRGERGAIRISVLGGFKVERDGQDLTPSPGQPTRLVQLLAVQNGRAHAEELMEALWPEVDPVLGRTRLRNVIARVRRSGGGLLARRGDLVIFGDEVEVDAIVFEDEAARALALAKAEPDEAAALATRAIRRCRGELLPDARYESWAAALRDRCRHRLVTLHDLLAQQAGDVGDLQAAITHTERAIELEPLDEHRYLDGARWLAGAGRRGAARALLVRGRAAWDALDLEPSTLFREVEQTL